MNRVLTTEFMWSSHLPFKDSRYTIEFCFIDQQAKDKLHSIMCQVSDTMSTERGSFPRAGGLT
jgi:hypothetical protein